MSVSKILVSQGVPKVFATYDELKEKYGVSFNFIPFFTIVPVDSKEIRAQHCNVCDYSAIVFSSRSTIDAFFSLCEELRFKIPETMKYFCSNEKVAMYLQKHIVYRKRKIFYGDGTPTSIINLITAKHKEDNFLIITSDCATNSVTKVFDTTEFKHSSAIFAKSVPADLKQVDIASYDMVVLYNKNDVKALFANFPKFKQGQKIFVVYGNEALKSAANEAGLNIAISAPTPECPTVASAIARYLEQHK